MTPDTAVFFMRKIKEAFEEGHLNTEAEALQMGIDALRRPEIIRCKDCKWLGEPGCAIEIVDDTDKPSENDYCSFAERKTDGD